MQTIKCNGCNKVLNGKGSIFYCDGCSAYYCKECALPVPDSYTAGMCPNCGIELNQANM